MARRDATEMGQYLTKCREQSGLTQAQLADLMGYSTPQFISNCERGMCMPVLASLPKLARHIPIKPNRFIEIYLRATKRMIHREMGVCGK